MRIRGKIGVGLEMSALDDMNDGQERGMVGSD